MPAHLPTLTLNDAKRIIAAGEAAADEIGVAYNLAVVDAGGNLDDRFLEFCILWNQGNIFGFLV